MVAQRTVQRAAASISSVVARSWEIIATCEEPLNSTVRALARLAMKRVAEAGMAWSSVATAY